MLNVKYPLLDFGYVIPIDKMGNDGDIAKSARVSYGKEDAIKTVEEDEALIRYLMRHKHTSPFEMCVVKFIVKMPIFIARQFIRHRMASINEVSGRYSVLENEFYIPDVDRIMGQDNTNKQGSVGDVDIEAREWFISRLKVRGKEHEEFYHTALNSGIAKELARIDLPLRQYTKFVWKQDLHNLFHMLNLRYDPHAQYEIRVFAEVMANLIKEEYPIAYQAWIDYVKEAKTFSRMEWEILSKVLLNFDMKSAIINSDLPKSEKNEFLVKIGVKK
jgi:thymidylate synthase (FAD)